MLAEQQTFYRSIAPEYEKHFIESPGGHELVEALDVPLERFASFWSLVRDRVKPTGRAMFVDDAYRTPDELAYGDDSELVRRRLMDGRAFRSSRSPTRRRTSSDGSPDLGGM